MERLFYISDFMIEHCMKEILEIYVHSCFDKVLRFHSGWVSSGLSIELYSKLNRLRFSEKD